MSPYREHQIERPEPWYARVVCVLREMWDAFAGVADAAWPYALAAAFVFGGTYGIMCAIDAGNAARDERKASLTAEARSWSTAVGFQVVGVYCYGDAVCDVSVGSAESMRVLYLHCVPGEGCVPR